MEGGAGARAVGAPLELQGGQDASPHHVGEFELAHPEERLPRVHLPTEHGVALPRGQGSPAEVAREETQPVERHLAAEGAGRVEAFDVLGRDAMRSPLGADAHRAQRLAAHGAGELAAAARVEPLPQPLEDAQDRVDRDATFEILP